MLNTGGNEVDEAVASMVALLRPAVNRDWAGVAAGPLDWDCRQTAEHVASDLVAYAGQLAGREQSRYVPFDITIDGREGGLDPADNEGILDVITTTGALLTAAVRTAPRDVRAFHPYPFRSANREGFAAMGIAEVLLHAHDMAEGLGLLPYEPPAHLAEFVLTRIFPSVRPGPDHWQTLLWATGRADLPGRARLTEWHWTNNLVLDTERLRLEGVTPAAAADLSAGGTGGFDWIEGGPFEGTRDAAGMVTKAYQAGVHRPEFGLYVLVRREDDRAVGGMGFHGAPDEDGKAEVGYDLAEPARGNGYATEALRTLAGWALARDDVRSLFATVEPHNIPSQAVITRVGFTPVSEEGEVDEDGLRAYELRG
ncbi:GNAT family N-acetyltransferase [Streptomyces sp. ME02-8801-2C]|uniref:GNAT family N-acetyltransferase n=1 Tax=Streptomyces sp. ME02-8801-2C TaxID=3028680 RepID=UPI0029B1ABA1|nr:GNAT family N-acetyltransferase [Streptomyces sp. ME02-8801-2C]MDX3455475.1 GNAT family N-acetyltransferase [Streptomyces sp. ME02-8801-2C]